MVKIAKKLGVLCSVAVVIGIVVSQGDLRTNKEALEIIGNAEGCYRDHYKCPGGRLTDGIGNTHGVKPDVFKTDQQIAEDWKKNILEAEDCINKYFRGKEMTDNTFGAMVSAAFNMGCYGLRFYGDPPKETTLHKLAVNGNWNEMCERLIEFINGGG